jgi:hypothetical protein
MPSCPGKVDFKIINQIRVFDSDRIERVLVPGGEGVRSVASMLHPFPEWDQNVTKKLNQWYRPGYLCKLTISSVSQRTWLRALALT